MAMKRPPSLPKVSLSAENHARVILAAAELGETVFQFMDRATTRELAQARHQVRVNRYNDAVRDADRSNKKIRPVPHEFGLSSDHGMPKP